MPQTVRFGCKKCGSPHLREKENKLFCASCGSVFEKNIETSEERDARILYLSRLDNSESYLRMSPPNFDEAEDRYRDFIKHYPENSDGYWGLVRARYGIKYETDASGKEIPSCYKSSYEDFRKDSDFLKALELAENEHISDDYFEKAKLIAGVCKEWREEAKKYEYDVFISFKATDDSTGKPTADTAEMHELYTYLLEEGYKVFFSPMSMRRYSGKHYDAYIFNALQSAKVMIVYGSKPEYFTTTWVQNEWTRFLRMQAKGEKKNGACVVAYKDFNPKELPHNLRAIQAINFADKKFYLEITNCIKNLLTEEKEVDTNAELLNQIEELKRQQEESRRKLREMEDNRDETTSATKAEEARKAEEEAKRKANNEAEVNKWYQNGVACYDKEDYANAVKWYTKAANQGHASAQVNLGVCYKNGQGVAQSYEKAVEWYTKAANQGNTSAQYNLGVCYKNGRGVAQSYEKAVEWYTKAANQGHASAQVNLGICYKNGQGVAQSYEKAVEWYTKAANQGEASAQFNLGVCYENGRGVAQSYQKAVEWYTKAANQGNASAQVNLGICYKIGRGVAQSYQKAVEWYTKAANQGHTSAQFNLGVCYDNGRGVAQSYQKAVEWYTKAANQGHASAQINLGVCYENGQGVAQSYQKAVEWYTKAANQGNASAQYNLGVCYEYGNGVIKNIAKAKEWYKKAADQGDTDAKNRLNRL